MKDKIILDSDLILKEVGISSSIIKSIKLWQKRSHYRAAINWLTKYEASSNNPTNLEKVKGFIEAFHHLCEVEEWERASKITFFQLNQSNPDKEIHNYLFDWGYLQETVNICESLLDKLPLKSQGILISSISHAYDQLGKYQEVIDLQPQLREIARQIKRPDFEATALESLGNAYQSLGRYHKAIEYHEAAMAIAIKLQDGKKISGCLNNLGNAYYFLQEYKKALQYFQQYLTAARELNNPEKEAGALLGIANCYRETGQYHDSIPYYQQSLTIAEEFGYRRLEASIQGGLGVVLKNIEQYQEAIKCYTKSLSLEREIGNRQGEATVLGNLGVVYRFLQEYQTAISYQEKAIAMCVTIGDKHGEGRGYINLGNVYEEHHDLNRAFACRIKGILVFHELQIDKLTKQLLSNYFPALVSVISQFGKNEEVCEAEEIASYVQIYTEQIATIIDLDIDKLNVDLNCNAIEKIVELIIDYFH